MPAKKAKQKSLLQLNIEIAKVEAQRTELFKLQAPINKKLTSTYQKLVKLKNERDCALASQDGDNWEWLLGETGNDSMEKHDHRDKKIYELGGIHSSGYYPETKQVAISLKLTKGSSDSFNHAVNAVKFLLPFIKPQIKDTKVFGVFEHTCSKYAVYNLHFKKNKITLERTSHGHQSTEATFQTTEEAVAYVQEHHWYEGGAEEEHEEEDD